MNRARRIISVFLSVLILLTMLRSKAGRFVLTLLARIILHVVRIKTFIRRAKRTAIGL